MPFEFTPERMATFQELLTHYPVKRAATLPTLHLAQEQNGYISGEVMEYVAGLLDTSAAQVLDVVTFYPMFFSEPVGKHIVRVCKTLPCELCGCGSLFTALKEKLGIGLEETTADGQFTLLAVECLAACNLAPVVMVDEDLYGNMTPKTVGELLDKISAGEPTQPHGAAYEGNYLPEKSEPTDDDRPKREGADAGQRASRSVRTH